MEETQERALRRETAKIELTSAKTPFSALDPNVRLAIECAAEKKAIDMVGLDLREIASFTEYFVIASGANQRQVQAISDEINEQLKQQLGSRPIRIEGYVGGEWVLMDYGDFVFHIFDREARDFYDLERLWRDGRKIEIPAELLLS
jgi:ribosome-associated protein